MQEKSEYLKKINTVLAVYKINTKQTNEQIAKRLKLSKYQLSNRQAGKTEFDLGDLYKIAQMTGEKLIIFE